MNLFLLILQLLASLILLGTVLSTKKQFNVKLNTFNVPLALIISLGVLAGTYLCFTHFWWFIPTGLFLGVLVWFLNSMDIPGETSQPLLKKIVTVAIAILFWNHFMALMLLYIFNKERFSNYYK